MITQKVFSDKLVFYRDGEPIYAFKLRPMKKELRELMRDETGRRGSKNNGFEKTQAEYNGTFRD